MENIDLEQKIKEFAKKIESTEEEVRNSIKTVKETGIELTDEEILLALELTATQELKRRERNVYCDKCRYTIEYDDIATEDIEVEGDIQARIFRCGNCKEVYIVNVTNEAIRKDIKRKQGMIATNKKTPKGQQYIARIRNLKNKILNSQTELKMLYEEQIKKL